MVLRDRLARARDRNVKLRDFGIRTVGMLACNSQEAACDIMSAISSW